MDETEFQQKLAAIFEANRDCVSIPKVYVDMTGGYESAAVLDEIMFWTLPRRDGKPGLRVFRDGKLWLAVRRAEWWERKRLTARQADTAIEKLVKLGLVEKEIFLFDGKPTVHLRLKAQVFVKLLAEKLALPISTDEISDLCGAIFPSQNREGDNSVNSILQDCKMLNSQNREIINIPLQPPHTSTAAKREISLPAGSDIGFLIASGMSDKEIDDYAKKTSEEREHLAFYEQQMGYGTTLDWWGGKPDMRALKDFLLTKSREEIAHFAAWCNRKYSKFRPEDAARFPRNVLLFWNLAFKDDAKNDAVSLDNNGVPVTY